MQTKYDVHDVVVYDHQGCLTASSITRIDIVAVADGCDEIYTMANGASILAHSINKKLGSLIEECSND